MRFNLIIRHKVEQLHNYKGFLSKCFEAIKNNKDKTPEAIKALASQFHLPIPEVEEDSLQLDPESKQKLLAGKSRVAKLKEDIKRTHAELLPDTEDFGLGQTDIKVAPLYGDFSGLTSQFIDELIDKNKDDPEKLASSLNVARSHLEGKKPRQEDRSLKKSAVSGMSKLPGLVSQPKRVLSISQAKPPTDSQLPVPQDSQLQQPQAPQQFPYQPNQQYQPYQPYQPWPAMYQQPQTDPELAKSLAEIKNVLEESTEKNKNLEAELKKLKDVKKAQQIVITPKVKSRETTPAKDEPATEGRTEFAQNEERADDLEEEEKALLNLTAQDYDELQLLAKLDPESELYKHKAQQYKEMAAHRADAEKVLQKQRLEKIAFDLDLRKKKMAGVTESAVASFGAVEKQKKESLLAALRKQYAAQAQDHAIISPTYDITLGFNVGIDFACNLPPEVTRLQVVFAVFSAASTVVEALQAGPAAVKEDRSKPAGTCALNFSKNVKFVPPSSELQMVFELQGVDSNGSPFTLGWTFINLFDSLNRLK